MHRDREKICRKAKDASKTLVEDLLSNMTWKEHVEKIMCEENEWYQMPNDTEDTSTEGYFHRNDECCEKDEIEKAARPAEVNTEMIVASSRIGAKFVMELCPCAKWKNNSS